MGIPSCRFVDKVHEEFICTVCLEVAVDPVLINDCDHIFCRKCIDGGELTKCPTCQGEFKDPKWQEMQGGYKRVYHALELKCLNPSCKQTLNVTTCFDHDDKCPITFDFCPECGYKFRRGSSSVHSCSQQVRMDQLGDQLVDERKRSNQQQVRLEQLEKTMAAERKRMEELIMMCISYRQNFDDWDRSYQNLHDYLKALKNGANHPSVNTMKKILEEYEKL